MRNMVRYVIIGCALCFAVFGWLIPRAAFPSVQAEGSWEQVLECAPGHSVSVVGFINDAFGITVGYMGESHYTTDGGKTWPEGKNQSLCRFALEIVNEKVAWSGGNGAHMRYTTDGGANWNEASDFGSFSPNHCRYLSFLNETTGWAATPNKLGSTSDQGKTWRDIPLPADVREIKAIDLRDPQNGYLLDQSGNLYSTEDGGRFWSKKTLSVNIEDYLTKTTYTATATLRFTDTNHGVVIMRQMKPTAEWIEFSTLDGGKTWRRNSLPGKMGTIYLSRDAKYISLIDPTGTIQVLRRP